MPVLWSIRLPFLYLYLFSFLSFFVLLVVVLFLRVVFSIPLQVRQRWACQATLHTCSALQKPPSGLTATEPSTRVPSPAFDNAGRPSKIPPSAMGAPLLSRLEPEIAAESFGTAVRMACADASAPYKLPLMDQHMFPEGEATLPVCLVQRYQHQEEEDDGTGGDGSSSLGSLDIEPVVAASTSPPISPMWGPAFRRPSSSLPGEPASLFTPVASFSLKTRLPQTRSPRVATAPTSPIGPRVSPPPQRAVSLSPRVIIRRDGPIAMLDASTAAAAVAAAVAAVIPMVGEDDDEYSPPCSPRPAQQRLQDHVRSNSVSPRQQETGRGEAGAGGRRAPIRHARSKHGRSLSPFKKGAVDAPSAPTPKGSSSPKKSRWPSWKSPRPDAAGGAAGAGVSSENSAGKESKSKEERRDAWNTTSRSGTKVDAYTSESDDSLETSGIDLQSPPTIPYRRPSREVAAPATPQRPPRARVNAQERAQAQPAVTPSRSAAHPPQSPSRIPASPLRRASALGSPARPRPKGMAGQRGRKGRGGSGEGKAGASGGGTGKGGGGAGVKKVRAGVSLLDGVEQSSNLGGFFRQGEEYDTSRRLRRVSSSARAGAGAAGEAGGGNGVVDGHEDEEDDDDDEEEEHGNSGGAGVHVVVLHHGYCGSSMDMRLIKNYIR